MDGETKRFFYHTPKTRELDNLLGDIYHKILGNYCRIFISNVFFMFGFCLLFETRMSGMREVFGRVQFIPNLVAQ